MSRPGNRDGPERPLRRLGESLGQVAGQLGLDSPVAFAAVLRGWEEAVGAQVAAHARPRALRSGVLTVSVDAAVWGTSLAFLENVVLDRLEAVAGERAVTALRPVVDPRLGQA
ncbi:MAG: DciA family protein [Acidimicrobiia bacterium]